MQTGIWTPSGFMPPGIATAQKAAEEYDPDLLIGRDEFTGDWVILLDSRREVGPHPVLRLGPELPGHDEIKRRLYEADVRRRGHKIVDDIARIKAAEERRMNSITHDAAGEVAEAMDTSLHLMKRHPVPRVFVPGGKD